MQLHRSGGRRRLWSAVLALAGVLALVVVGVTVVSDRGTDGADVRPIDPGEAARLAGPPPPVAMTPSPTTQSPTTQSPRTSAPGSRPAALRPVPTPPASARPARPSTTASRPDRVVAPSIGLDARVVGVGVTADGGVEIPTDVATVGWYRFSARPGSSSGSTVLVGHVDSAQQGEGAFFDLRDLGRGARVDLDVTGGHRQVYEVVSREQFPKGAVPLQALFATTGRPRLTLITCGGSFDETIRSYRDNVVITAVPA